MTTKEPTVRQPRQNEHVICFTSDIIEEILARLPASSLLRFRCVCKQWRDIISDPRFIIAHVQHAQRCLLLFFPREWGRGGLQPGRATIFDEAWSPSTWAALSMEPDDHLFASCNGLLCFYKTFTIKIANPATGECLNLAKPGRILINDVFYLYSFGFHPMTKEYKLIHFLREPHHYNAGNFFQFNVIQVYTLGTDKWRDVRAPSSSCLVNQGIVSVDGAMYWLTEDKGMSCGHAVMSFDLKGESFTSIQPPPFNLDETDQHLAGNGVRPYNLTELDGKVCMLTAPRDHLTQVVFGKIEMWTLESKREQRWNHKYSIQVSLPEQLVPRQYSVHREKILLLDRDDNAYCHELADKNVQIEKSRKVKLFNSSPHKHYDARSFVYIKTLVPLDIYSGAALVRIPKRARARPVATRR